MIDLALGEEQQQIVAAAVDMLEKSGAEMRAGGSGAGEAMHARLAEWGWFGMGLAQVSGGLGLGICEEALLYIEAGRFLLPPSVLASSLAAGAVEGEAREALLGGWRRAALAITGGEGEIYCLDREGASHVAVMSAGGRIHVIPADAFAGEAIDSFDETVTLERGRFAGTFTGEGLDGGRGVLLISAMLAGIARSTCDLAVEYAKVREQFGQPIGAFQAVKHLCADLGIRAYAAEAQVKLAAVVAAEAAGDAPFQIAAAAVTAIEAAVANAEAAIQIHGGMGFTAECDVHRYLKRARLLSRVVGSKSRQLQNLIACPRPAGQAGAGRA